MKYISTRGKAPALGFEDVLLTGLAEDGGLYVPESMPQFSTDDIRAMRGLSYAELAHRVMTPFLGGALSEGDFRNILNDVYTGFGHEAVTPLVQMGADNWLLELFHGPTLAFKDVALQLIGPLFDHALSRQNERVTIVGATSGDTGSAAIAAFQGRERADIFILYPHGRVSDVQRRQMTTVKADNVHTLALEGTFDDCQDMVKAMFADRKFQAEIKLGAVNSINWARVMAQTVYYFWASLALGGPDRPVAFTVPTGNFGDIFAGYVASSMGLPIEQLVIATNENDILVRTLETGTYAMDGVRQTLSPSMDIQISSNFERLLFDLYGREGSAIEQVMQDLKTKGRFSMGQGMCDDLKAQFRAGRTNDAGTKATIHKIRQTTGMTIDPHTAVGVAVAEQIKLPAGVAMVTLATAHPAKFPDAVEAATGYRPALPPALADLHEREEHITILPNDLGKVQDYIRSRARIAEEVAS